ncbi:hypothetical protein C8F04DRAFT_1179653 [Mycena alexandri]|uniref:Uncharacterized protein n=1 Tax=Mycena alexandri TaxID=1745969 RepID=A0AAD6T3H8_9AGAR|nr:hypothetical protein C8F04DRAFT_1179653 [Mycena alexandri]
MSHRCPYCQSSQPTRLAVNRHISRKAACQEKWRESLGVVVTVRRDESEPPEEPPQAPDSDSETPPRAPSPAFFSREVPDEEEEDDHGDDFVPPPAQSVARARARARGSRTSLSASHGRGEHFPGFEKFTGSSAETLGEGQTIFEKMHSEQTNLRIDPHAKFIHFSTTADGYNTEAPERLHIDLTKKAYRSSSKRDYTAQMTLWLQPVTK